MIGNKMMGSVSKKVLTMEKNGSIINETSCLQSEGG